MGWSAFTELPAFWKRAFKMILAFAMVVGNMPLTAAFGQSDQQSPDVESGFEFETTFDESRLTALEEIQAERLNRGLIGFEGNYELPEDGTPVSVIVVFEHSPAPVQVIEAQLAGEPLTLAEAEAIVEEEHELFAEELSEAFPQGRARNLPGFEINWEYREALNGVSITIPANRLEELANFESVRAIYPNVMVHLDPVDFEALDEAISESRNPRGMAPGRESMGADELHAQGITGAGILVAVLDTGVDYFHPAFPPASFPTLAQAQALNPYLPNEAGMNPWDSSEDAELFFLGRNFIDDVALFPTLAGMELGEFDPMETTYAMWRHANRFGTVPRTNPDGSGNFFTNHGTHVAGTIAGRDSGEENGILGVAPDALMIHYRVLGPRGGGATDGIVAAIQQALRDGADIVNMSLGVANNTPAGWPTTTAVNNIKLAYEHIVMVVAAGNSGTGFHTVGSPATATTAISVGNIVEAGYVGLEMEVGGEAYDLRFGATNPSWFEVGPNGNIVTNIETAIADEAGNYQLFALPRTNETNGSVGQAPGVGVAADFAELERIHGRDALEGAFVLVRRGAPFVAVAASAIELGLGGVIVINNDDANSTGGVPALDLPYVFIGLGEGLALYSRIREANPATAAFTGFIHSPFTLSDTSSRGPIQQSFEIKPDLGANGTRVLSAVPAWWLGDGGGDDYTVAYAFANGTSMAAPHVAGAVALMMEYNRDWTNEEIKVRLMNTATPFDRGLNFSVFETGAGYANVLAAIQADATVSVHYDRVATVHGTPFARQPFQTALTGSFSFGGINTYFGDEGIERTLLATIDNNQSYARTFSISYEFVLGGRQVQAPGQYVSLELSENIVQVAPNGSTDFDATMVITAGAPLGFYEGFITVTEGDAVIARLPFAGVLTYERPTLHEVATARPVISLGAARQNTQAGQLAVYFTPNYGFATQMWLVRDVEGINEGNWDSPEFADAYIGFVGTRFVPNATQNFIGQQHRAVLFQGTYAQSPAAGYFPATGSYQLTEEGDYFIVMEIFRQVAGGFQQAENILVPFSVDNTAPELEINGLEVVGGESDALIVALDPTDINPAGDVVLTGNVFDAWLEVAEERGLSFDIWNENAPFGPAADQSFNAVLVQVGTSAPIRAEVDSEGNFTVTLEGIADTLPVNVTVTAVDNYSVIPRVNGLLGSGSFPNLAVNGWVNTLAQGLVLAEAGLNAYLRPSILWGVNHPQMNDHLWSGLNASVIRFSLTLDGQVAEPGDTPGFDGEDRDISADFTDPGFEWRVRHIMGLDRDEPIMLSAAREVTLLNMNSVSIQPFTPIRNFDGLEHFYNLRYLVAMSFLAQDVTEIDLSGNPNLVNLNLQGAGLRSIDLSNNPNLRELGLASQQGRHLTELDVSNNPLLIAIQANQNSIASIDLSNNPLLQFLELNQNALTEIDLSGLYYLETLNLSGSNPTQFAPGENRIEEIDLSDLSALRFLTISSTALEVLDLSENLALETLTSSASPYLRSIILPEGAPNLRTITANNNAVTGTFELSDAPNLTSVTLSSNAQLPYGFTGLVLRNNPALTNVVAGNNNISYIDFTGSDAITTLNLNLNGLENIAVADLPAGLTHLQLLGNNLETVHIGDHANLVEVNVSSNQITEFSIGNVPNLTQLIISDNRISGHLDLTGLPLLNRLPANNNYLTSLDVTGTNLGNVTGFLFNFGGTLDVRNNLLTGPDDVAGWRTLPLEIGVGQVASTFRMWPQRETETPPIQAPTIDRNLVPTKITGVVGEEFFFRFFSDSVIPVTWTVDWPHEDQVGLTLQPDLNRAGFLYGVPAMAGTWEFGVTATNAQGADSERFILTILPAEEVIETNPEITEAFTDPGFTIRVRQLLGLEQGAPIFLEDVQGVTELNLNSISVSPFTPIRNFDGLQYFSDLEVLIASGMIAEADSIDLSGNPQMRILRLRENNFTSIDVSNLPYLEELDVSFQRMSILGYLEALDVTENPELRILRAGNNRLSELDLANSPQLEILEIQMNDISEVDLSLTPNLRELDVTGQAVTAWNPSGRNQITQLDLSYVPNLQILTAGGLPLTALDLSANVNLEGFVANNLAQLETFTLPERAPYLRNFTMINSGLTGTFDLSNAPSLTQISLGGNRIESLILRNNTALTNVLAANNAPMTAFDASGSHALANISLGGNSVEAFDFEALPDSVHTLNLFGNNLTEAIVIHPNLSTSLNLNNNNLESVDFTQAPGVTVVMMHNNQITGELDFTNNPSLHRLDIHNNFITGVDVTGTQIGTVPNWLGVLDVRTNEMTSPNDVIGWRDLPIAVNGNFLFWPQRNVETPTFAAPVITTTEVPTGVVGEPFEFYFETDSEVAVEWEVIWPHTDNIGLTLWPDDYRAGRLSGIPTLPGSWDFGVRAINIAGFDEEWFTITILEAAEITVPETDLARQELQDLVNRVNGLELNPSHFTNETWYALETALANALMTLQNTEAELAAIHAVIYGLESALENLEFISLPVAEIVNALSFLVGRIDDLGLEAANFTADSWSELQKALETAQAFVEKHAETDFDALTVDVQIAIVAEATAAYDGILAALANLEAAPEVITAPSAEEQAAFEALRDLVDTIQQQKAEGELLPESHKKASWAVFTRALEAAEGLLGQFGEQSVSEEQLTQALDELTMAFAALELVVNIDNDAYEIELALSELRDLIESKEGRKTELDASQFEATAWAGFAAALENAREVVAYFDGSEEMSAPVTFLGRLFNRSIVASAATPLEDSLARIASAITGLAEAYATLMDSLLPATGDDDSTEAPSETEEDDSTEAPSETEEADSPEGNQPSEGVDAPIGNNRQTRPSQAGSPTRPGNNLPATGQAASVLVPLGITLLGAAAMVKKIKKQ